MSETNPLTESIESCYKNLAGSDISPVLRLYIEWLKETVIPEFVKNNLLAVKWQKRYRMTIQSIHMISVIIVTIVISQAIFFPHHHQLLWIEVVLICMMFAFYFTGKKGKYHLNWLKYRFISERLRSAIFSFVLYDQHDVKKMLEEELLFLITQEVRHEWKTVIENIFTKMDEKKKPRVDVSTELSNIKHFIMTRWLDDQSDYHTEKMKSNGKRYSAFETLGFLLLGITLIAAVLHSFGIGNHVSVFSYFSALLSDGPVHSKGTPVNLIDTFTFSNLFVVIAVIFPSIAAAIHAVAHSFEMHKLSFRSQMVIKTLEGMKTRLGTITDPDDLPPFLADLTGLFAREHEEWHSIVALNEPVVT